MSTTTLEKALDHIGNARRKNSKAAAWNEASFAAAIANNRTVHADATGRWPDLERLEKDVRAELGPDRVIVTRHDGTPDMKPEQRGQDLTVEEMTAAKARLTAYVVIAL